MDLSKICTTRLLDQNFGMCISPQDILMPFLSNNVTNYYRPWKLCEEITTKDFGSTIDNSKDNFRITLDVQHFRPNEVSVRVNDKEIIVEGKHEEKEDEHGSISRQFIRKYRMPKDCLANSVISTLSSDGVLCILAKKQTVDQIKTGEKNIPIKMAGPCRKTDMKDLQTTDNCEIKKDKCEMKMDKCEIKKVNNEMKNDQCGMKKDTEQITNKCEMKKDNVDKNEAQLMLKEEHSRLLKPELLGGAVSGTEKLLSDSRKETDELLKLMSSVNIMTNPTEEILDAALGQCKAAMKELKKDKLETNMSAISGMASLASEEMSMTSSEITSSSMSSAEKSSMKRSMTSETVEMSMSSNSKASSDIVSEIICAELYEAASEKI